MFALGSCQLANGLVPFPVGRWWRNPTVWFALVLGGVAVWFPVTSAFNQLLLLLVFPAGTRAETVLLLFPAGTRAVVLGDVVVDGVVGCQLAKGLVPFPVGRWWRNPGVANAFVLGGGGVFAAKEFVLAGAPKAAWGAGK